MKQFYPELKNWKGKCVGDAEIFYPLSSEKRKRLLESGLF